MHIAGKKNTDGSALIDETNKQLFDCVDMNKDGKLSVSDVTALQIHISQINSNNIISINDRKCIFDFICKCGYC